VYNGCGWICLITLSELISKLRNANVNFDAHPVRNDGAIWGYLKSNFSDSVDWWAIFPFRRSSNIPRPRPSLNFGKSRARSKWKPKPIKFDDVAGIDEAKEELQEVVTNNPNASPRSERASPKAFC